MPIYQARLQKNYENIINNIHPTSIVDHLITEFILEIDDRQVIESYPSDKQKMRKLVEILMNVGERGYIEFLSSLRSDNYGDIADMIEKTEITEDEMTML